MLGSAALQLWANKGTYGKAVFRPAKGFCGTDIEAGTLPRRSMAPPGSSRSKEQGSECWAMRNSTRAKLAGLPIQGEDEISLLGELLTASNAAVRRPAPDSGAARVSAQRPSTAR